VDDDTQWESVRNDEENGYSPDNEGDVSMGQEDKDVGT